MKIISGRIGLLVVMTATALTMAGCTLWPSGPTQLSPSNDAAIGPSGGVVDTGSVLTEPIDQPVRVSSPLPNQEVSNPLVVEGEARGYWFFEASFPVRLYDASGRELGTGIAQALDDWMTEEFVPFRATIEFASPADSGAGTLALQCDNPSGLPEHDRTFEVPVRLAAAAETTTVKAFFNNSRLDPEITCTKVFPVERRVAKTPTIGRTALLELLAGPTAAEQADGYFTSLNSGVGLNSLTITDGVARADFDEQMEFQMGGSCRVGAIRAQITETLKQFPTVREVVISVNGRTEDILQP